MRQALDTHQRALAINLDPTTYGTFAEIGAGQEVARWFLQVGGAAGTVAKTISAYDMAFSDAIYGKAERYVSRGRLVEMLDHEYPLLLARLDRERTARSRYFVFADTISARNYAGSNECHGWLGLRFQTRPRAEPSDILLHVSLGDPSNLLQQQAVGILGVNLVHAAFFGQGPRARRFAQLQAGLSLERIEIDFVEFSGPAFAKVEGRVLAAELVGEGLARAVALTPRGALVPPSELLRKRAIVLERCGPSSTAAGELDLRSAAREHARERGDQQDEPLLLRELSLHVAEGARRPSASAVQRRCAKLCADGLPLLLSSFAPGVQLSSFLRRYTQQPLAQVVDVARMLGFLRASSDPRAAARAFVSLGELLGLDVRLLVAPQEARELRARLRRAQLELSQLQLPDAGLVRADQVGLQPPQSHLLAYLLASGCAVPLGRAGRPRAALKSRARARSRARASRPRAG